MERRPLVRRRQEHDAHREELEERLPLPEPAGGQRDAALGRERAVHRDAHLAHGDDGHRGPREVAVDAEREEPAEHEELVGQRIEERARAGRAVASGQPAVEPVGGGEHEPEANVSQVEPASTMSSSVGHREHEPGDGDEVGRGGDRASSPYRDRVAR